MQSRLKSGHENRAELPSEVFDAGAGDDTGAVAAEVWPRKAAGTRSNIKGGSKVAFEVTPSGAFLLKPVGARLHRNGETRRRGER